MRKTLLILTFSLFVNYGFSQKVAKIENKTIDPKLVGCWKGSEIGQQSEGLSKYWVSCRNENGTSTLLFIAIDKNGEVIQETENGKWWVENGKFYELHNFDGLTDIYDYEVIEDSTYSFLDYKIEDN